MGSGGFTIRIYVPDGDPGGIRIIDRLNWTGKGFVFPRDRWAEAKARPELSGPGIYILTGYRPDSEDPDRPTIYIGQAENVQIRIDAHDVAKDFWDRAAVFVSTSGGLHRGHITWLEHALISRAAILKQCYLDNGNAPGEPFLSEADRADTAAFLTEILQILPLVNIRAFEVPRAIPTQQVVLPSAEGAESGTAADTVVVAGYKEGFDEVFLGQNEWHSIRIGGGMIPKIKYIAGYQNTPISAITHYAPVARIEPYADSGKYRLVFAEPAKAIGPIPLGDAPWRSMRSSRYTTLQKLLSAKSLSDLF